MTAPRLLEARFQFMDVGGRLLLSSTEHRLIFLYYLVEIVRVVKIQGVSHCYKILSIAFLPRSLVVDAFTLLFLLSLL